MTSRRDQTTSFIRDAAVRELVENGHALLTMESVARRSFSSVGSVYARYPDRSHLLADVLGASVMPVLRSLDDHGPGGLDALMRRVFSDASLAAALHALVEISMASRMDPSLRGGSLDGIHMLRRAFPLRSSDPALEEGIRTQLTATVLGHFVMTGAGCAVPPLGPDIASLVAVLSADGGDDDPDARNMEGPAAAAAPRVALPAAPPERERDGIARTLTDETAHALAESGLAGARLRDIAQRAGVTTGAVYRRYGSKNELVNDVLVRELNNDKYGWTGEFVEALVSDPSRFRAAQSMARAVRKVIDDPLRLLAGIEIMQAARTDPTVRHTVATQVHDAAHARTRMMEELVAAGVARDRVNPRLVGWLMQITPAGNRVLAMMGIEIDEDVLTRTLQAYLRAVA